MSELFTVVPPAEAFTVLAQACTPVVGTETIPLWDAGGRTLVADVVAAESIPGFPRSTMDGYAVRAADTRGAGESSPAYLRLAGEVLMGRTADIAVPVAGCIRIHTGAMLPPEADAVVMVEDTNLHGGEVEVLATVAPGENVLRAGEDVRAGAVALRGGTRLGTAQLGALAALGIVAVPVRRRPRVAIISTGDEVVAPDEQPCAAGVRDVNSTTLAAVVAAAGGVPLRCGIVPDDAALIEGAARAALADADALVLSAGSSVSARDLTARVIDRLGAPGVLVHGIAIKPGKPTIVALCDGVPVIGLPGNPASALVVALRLVRPLVRLLAGEAVPADGRDLGDAVVAMLAANVPSRPGREDYVPCRLAFDDHGRLVAQPTPGASNLIFTLANADGLVVVPRDRAGCAAGERVDVVAL